MRVLSIGTGQIPEYVPPPAILGISVKGTIARRY